MIIAGLWFIVLFLFAALTIELGHIFIVRIQLQNAADATAKQGAAYLYPSVNGPNWSLATTQATAEISKNKVNNIALVNGTITTGYWSLNNSTLQPTSITPITGDVAAVKAVISKSAGNNGGPEPLFFGNALGLSSVDISATAIAVVGSPSAVDPGDVFPVAMAKSLYDVYWDPVNNKPKNDPATGQPYIFNINSGPQGGWTTFLEELNNSPAIISLIENGNPTALAIGQSIYFAPGVKNDVYSHVPLNKDVFIAVTSGTDAGTFQPIVAFGALHIIQGIGGSTKVVQVQFTTNLKMPNAEPGGPSYGIYTPPRFVK